MAFHPCGHDGDDDDWLGWETARFNQEGGGGDARWTQVYTIRDALVLA